LKTADKLKSLTVKDLVQLARKRGVLGWHSMRKEQLISELTGIARHQSKSVTRTRKSAPVTRSANIARGTPKRALPTNAKSNSTLRRSAKSHRVRRRLQDAKLRSDRLKNLASYASNGSRNGFAKDRLVVMVRDPYWLHAYWELTRQSVERAEAAMGQDWHMARPVLRLLDVSGRGTTSSAETVLRHIDIHGGVNNWYIDVQDPPKTYRLDIGYLAASGRFYSMTRSNIVTTPPAAASDALDENWTDVAENFDKIYAMSGGYASEGNSTELQELFEERLRRPMGSPVITRYGAGVHKSFDPRGRRFAFDVDAELIVYGATAPDAHVTLQGEPVQLRPDGTFTVRFSLPNSRQVIPAVASSADGVEQQTVVLAIERNTKTMEPVIRDANS